MTWFEEHVKPSVEWEGKAKQAVLSDDEVKTITEYREKYNNPHIYMSAQNRNYLVEYLGRHTGDIILHNSKIKKSFRRRVHQYLTVGQIVVSDESKGIIYETSLIIR
ncbi:hypothetical protein FOG31_00185 [Staphylococcus aureus]|uniref:hypothetical protein n=1 Tax=Staphylococcus aureus TaxID=1280 RepID=UPI001CF3A316|nr:hypothetical protein [Staphylococcus aureus]MBZ8160676.1 hypothetical protein [Staphylococcus aureus]MBZ8163364.1 hypothetical protein [Staphylococcus aureus]MBZ8168589.1 hypothetical protein [Staphylococcus aureus]